MPYIQKARLSFFGIDDELKEDENSIYTTKINSSFYTVPAALTTGAGGTAPTYENQQYGVSAVDFTTRKNTKLFRFNLNGILNNIELSNKAKIIFESVNIPKVISNTFKQSKAVNNIQLRLKWLPNNNIYDSTTKGRGSTVIFLSPVFFNTQGFGETYSTIEPDKLALQQRPKKNADNNGHLYINSSPDKLHNFGFLDSFLKVGFLKRQIIRNTDMKI